MGSDANTFGVYISCSHSRIRVFLDSATEVKDEASIRWTWRHIPLCLPVHCSTETGDSDHHFHAVGRVRHEERGEEQFHGTRLPAIPGTHVNYRIPDSSAKTL